MLPTHDGPTHPYMVSSAACWAAFGDLLAADYSSPERMAFHQLVVDAYAAQHPGGDDPRQLQSVGLHLMTLCLFLDHDVSPETGPSLHRRMIRCPAFRRLRRSGYGALTVTHVPVTGPAEAARAAAYEWARSVWDAYAEERPTIEEWLRTCGFDAG